MKRKNLFKLQAFTLAEVLVTLVVIGVIASLTIPALLTNLEDAQLKTQWKEAFSIISQAAGKQMANESQTDVDTVKNYMQVMKDCSINQTLPECAMTCPNGWFCNIKPTNSAIFVTTNGMQWGDFNGDQRVIVDVNGIKPPNELNRDALVFCFYSNGRVIPSGAPGCNDATFTANSRNWLRQ